MTLGLSALGALGPRPLPPALLSLLLSSLLSLPWGAAPGAQVAVPRKVRDPDTDGIVAEFVARQRVFAEEAYEKLYGDGRGLDSEEPPSRETFGENYIVEALNSETRRVLEAKGYATREPPRGSAGVGSALEVEKKDMPSTLEGLVERMAVQKRQRGAVRERAREGKPLEVLEPSVDLREVLCAEALYTEHVYAAVPGCSPGPPAGQPCSRLILDGVATAEESAAMMATMDAGLQGLFHQGAETLLVPGTDSQERLGKAGYLLTASLLERVRGRVAAALNISEVFYSGSLLKRMDHPPLEDAMQVDLNHDSSNPHADKANIASYDWSALLYFSSVGADFDGGELLFLDEDADRLVRPLAGRLVAFSSGLENLHRVQPMSRGQRYVLSMWFTCSRAHAHPGLGLPLPASGGGPADDALPEDATPVGSGAPADAAADAVAAAADAAAPGLAAPAAAGEPAEAPLDAAAAPAEEETEGPVGSTPPGLSGEAAPAEAAVPLGGDSAHSPGAVDDLPPAPPPLPLADEL